MGTMGQGFFSKFSGGPLPQLTTSPPPECFTKDPKDQIIESLK